MKVKTPREDMKKDVVYEVPCMDSDMNYIRETGRGLDKRIVEHKAVVKTKDDKNGIAVHANGHNHQVDWEGPWSLNRNPGTGGGESWKRFTSKGRTRAIWTVGWH